MKINKKGFTLIELLGVIAVVSLVLGLSIYGIGKIIENSKAKSEEISISGIERAASTYSGEAEYGQWQIKDKKEYFCITVGELVNKGMLKKDSVSGKTNYDLSSYVAVVKDYDTRVLEKSKLILNDDTSSTEYQVCTGTVVGDGETATLPNISGGSTYADEIVSITFTDGSTNLSDKVIDGSRKCFYGTSSSNINNTDNVIVDEVNKTCNISKLKQSTDYYVKVCMGLTSGAYVCSNTNEYKTKSIAKPQIAINSSDLKVTITYSGSNIKENHYNYFYSPIAGTSNKNVVSCTERNNVMTCSESSTTTITKNTWYKIGEDTITLTYSGEDNGTLKARTYDKTNNYSEGTKGLKINKIEFKKGTADKIGGGTSDITKRCLAEGNNGCDVTSPTIEKAHYTVVGWNTNSTATTSTWNVNTNKTVKNSATYYPITKAKEFIVTYKANGGTGDDQTQTVIYDSDWTTKDKIFTKTGYTQIGWSIRSENNNLTHSLNKEQGTWTGTSNITLYAVWQANKYTITYDANGGDEAPAAQTYTYASSGTTKLSSTTPTRSSYTFKGWSLDKNATEKTYDAGQDWSLSNANNYTLYAVWQQNSSGPGTIIIPQTCDPSTDFAWCGNVGCSTNATCLKTYSDCSTQYVCCNRDRCNKENGGSESGGCFLAGTKIITPTGQKNIEELKIGDYVYSYNEKNNTVELDTVRKNYSLKSNDNIYTIYTENASVSVTSTHPFYVKNKGYVQVKYLKKNDVLLNNLGQEMPITKIKIDKNKKETTVYNLSVSKNHNYFAGLDSILVHNKLCFLAGTKVMTNKGYKNIENIKTGDMVLTYNEERMINEYQPVNKLWILNKEREKLNLHTITLDDKSNVKSTANHRFFVKRNGITSWIEAENIMIGDYVRYSNGKYHKVIKNTYKTTTDIVYTLSVENTHNYYVGENQILVHNATFIGNEIWAS